MYRCLDCGSDFDHTKTIQEPFGEWHDVCPFCESEEVEELFCCDLCGKALPEENLTIYREGKEWVSICEDCRAETAKRFSTLLRNTFYTYEIEVLEDMGLIGGEAC